MRLRIKMEDGLPLIVLDEECTNPGMLAAYSQREEHVYAHRDYVNRLKSPRTDEERAAAWRALAQYAEKCAYVEGLQP